MIRQHQLSELYMSMQHNIVIDIDIFFRVCLLILSDTILTGKYGWDLLISASRQDKQILWLHNAVWVMILELAMVYMSIYDVRKVKRGNTNGRCKLVSSTQSSKMIVHGWFLKTHLSSSTDFFAVIPFKCLHLVRFTGIWNLNPQRSKSST